ncbi:sensor histidine kinase [Cohnella kolymensis]|uniref:sensor histidine kinase n=1 Tax=Cohnella kolymensis TaxID=1590652 RepID=UPI000696A024|nr:HAMP domain-containing sensor histidine kinase [Cohnella kolymensis]
MLLSDPRSAVARRLSALAFSGGAGALAATLASTFIPYINANYPNLQIEDTLYHVQATSSLISYYGVPYTFLLFSLAYRSVRLSGSWKWLLPLILLLPIAGCLILTPPYNEMYPVSHDVVVWWAVPYFMTGTALVLWRRQDRYFLSPTHWILCLAVLPPVLFCMLMSYVLPSFGVLRMWIYNTLFVGIGVAVFVIGLFTYGFMGVRVMIERRRLDSTLRAVTSGTAILNHAIKNDVGKMRLFGEKIKSYAENTGQPELLEDIRIVLNASLHIQDMISRVHRRTEDLVIKPGRINLGELIHRSLTPHKPMMGNIQLIVDVPAGWICTVDPAQVGEAVNNLVSNAVDALAGEGELYVALRESKRELTIEIRDTGPGMDKAQIALVLQPFYTTKGGNNGNFGLGLPYVYYVMRKHRGSLRIHSKAGFGTSVYLTFPKRNVQAEYVNIGSAAKGVDAYGTH